jgi:hypothetical protein
MARPWRLARSLTKLRDQVNARHPKRKKTHDGTIGDKAHSKRVSDHNPSILDDIHGVVSALDLTHDPPHFDAHRFAEHLRTTKDFRLKYVISNGRIFSAPGFTWRKYTGSNPHRTHVHISVKGSKAHYDSAGAWVLV